MMALGKFKNRLKAERSTELLQELKMDHQVTGYWDYCQCCGTKVDDPEKRTGLCRMHTRL